MAEVGPEGPVRLNDPARRLLADAVSEDERALFVTSMDGAIRRLDAGDGSVVWTVPTGGPVRAAASRRCERAPTRAR